MSSKFLVVIICLFCLPLATAQAQSTMGRVGPDEDVPPPTASPTNGDNKTAKTDPKKDAAAKKTPAAEPKKSEPKADEHKSEPTPTTTPTATPAPSPLTTAANAATEKTEANTTTDAPAKSSGNTTRESPPVGLIPPPPKYIAPTPLGTSENANATSAPAPVLPPTSLYRVGVGDVLDIRLVNSPARNSTLYTILTGGMLDYPLAGDAFSVSGLTTEEIATRLAAELKRRGVFDRAQFNVTVRDYLSHTVMISGLVDQPGHKILRREAVPLYVVLADALPRGDAGRAVIISRAAGTSRTVDLGDPAALNELVAAGDVINVQARPPEFFYIGGLIATPGQKDFHAGMTLTQALLACGGVTSAAGNKVRVTVSRQGVDGRLIATDYLLKEIEAGQVPDPRLQPGDRIEVARSKR